MVPVLQEVVLERKRHSWIPQQALQVLWGQRGRLGLDDPEDVS